MDSPLSGPGEYVAPGRRGPEPTPGRRPRGAARCSVGALMDRLDYFARLVADDPGVARARFGYANELLRAGRDDDAVAQLRAYLELAEDEGNAWGRLGESLARLGRVDEA